MGKFFADIALTTIAIVMLSTANVAYRSVQVFRKLFGYDYFNPWRKTNADHHRNA